MSVLTNMTRLSPVRIGLWYSPPVGSTLSSPRAAPPPAALYVPDKLLCAVEPQVAAMLELQKLVSFRDLVNSPSRNRQCHTFTVLEKRDARSLTLKRVFLRCALGAGLGEGGGWRRRLLSL